MNTTRQLLQAFDNFWGHVVRAEKIILRHSHRGFDLDAGDNWDEPFEAAFNDIRRYLRPISEERQFFLPMDAPARYPVVRAASAHEALMKFLNPPEALFGLVPVLSSPEYRQLRREATREFEQMQARMPRRKPKLGIGKSAMLLAAGLMKLHQFDNDTPLEGPFSQKRIGEVVGWCQSRVSRMMKRLFPDGMSGYRKMCRSGKIHRGFFKRCESGSLDVEAVFDGDRVDEC